LNAGTLFVIGRDRLIRLSRYTKRAILAAADFAMLSAALWAAVSVRYNELYLPESWQAGALLAAAPLMTIAVFAWFGLYRFVTRYMNYRGNVRIIQCGFLAALGWGLLVFMSGQHGVPRSVILAYGPMAIVTAILIRQIAGWILSSAGIKIPVPASGAKPKPVLIIGAGAAGAQLVKALRADLARDVVGFVDDDRNLWGQLVGDKKVHRPERLARLIERHGVKEVLLAMPEASRKQRQQTIKDLQAYPVEVKILPSIAQIAAGRVRATDLRPVDVGDLLGRDPVPPDEGLLARSIRGKSVLVTGAGGSVGSEIVRQIVKRGPGRVVLFDVSEAALFQIETEVAGRLAVLPEASRPRIAAVLGSVLDEALVRTTLAAHAVEVVYHAAAYKHVPMVERNFVVGLNNNVFGTAILAECAKAARVERFVLISTDKAVRPCNVMGASKRLSELVLQAHAADPGGTIFTNVRFGNVLDSSGSVVPTFRKQIEAGGPVTVTHPEVVRYFMSIPEAAELVLQAGSMAAGGEVFVLDMGEPIKIDALARLMVRLSGLEVLSAETPDGDILIEYTGLRPGEKLYEELLIDARAIGTEHPRIARAEEPCLSPDELENRLEQLRAAMAAGDRDAIVAELTRTVDGYTPGPREAMAAPGDGANDPPSRVLH